MCFYYRFLNKTSPLQSSKTCGLRVAKQQPTAGLVRFSEIFEKDAGHSCGMPPRSPSLAPPHHLRIVIFIEKPMVLHILLRKMLPHHWF